jgi:HK97 family phage major capsid protein
MVAQATNRATSGVNLPTAVSGEIWQSFQEQSAVAQLATNIPLPGSGVSVDIITGDPTAAWTAETEEKPVSDPTVASKVLRGYTLAVIEPFSNQFKRDKAQLYSALVGRLPGILAAKLDNTVMFGTAPGSDFDTLTAAPATSINTSVYTGLLAALSSVAANGGDVDGWALSPSGELKVLGALDAQNRPIFIGNVQNEGQIGSLLGRPVYKTKAAYKAAASATPGPQYIETLGFAGDWSQSYWGQVEAIDLSISTDATINKGGTQINLWQRNMFAVRAEIEIGFRVQNVNQFARLTGATVA